MPEILSDPVPEALIDEFPGDEASSTPDDEHPDSPSDEAIPAAADSDELEGEPRSPAELRLEEAVSRYLAATSDQRVELADPLRAAVDEARSANALDGLARAMNSLLAQPVPDAEAEALADDLMNVATQMRMAIHLGSVQDERERSDIVTAYAKLGDPMATVIADALTETDDRLARKTYMSALVGLGQ